MLGTIIGDPAKRGFGQLGAHLQRHQKALKYVNKIGSLPYGHRERLRDDSIFGRATACYGWIAGLPPKKQRNAFDVLIWKRLGATRFAPPSLRSLVGGCHLEFGKAVLVRQTFTRAMRDITLNEDNRPLTRTNLDDMVDQGLFDLGWFRTQDGSWQHAELPDTFNEANFVCRKRWKEAAHSIRMSMRMKEYANLQLSARHEINEELPPFDHERFQQMRKWIDGKPYDAGRFFFSIGAVQSPATAFQNGYDRNTTCKCGIEAPNWEHIWRCYLNEVPDDLMLRRFLWPRGESDYPKCQTFMDAIHSIRPRH